MKTFKVEILRRKSQFTEWYKSGEIKIRAKNIDNVLKRLHKLESPYQIHGKIEEVKGYEKHNY